MLIEVLAQSRFVQKVAGLVGLTGTQLGSLRVSQIEADGDEMTRAGLRYHMSACGATGIAPVQAIPSTAAQWMIYNPLSNPVTAFLDRIGMVELSGTIGVTGNAMWAAIVPPKYLPSTIPTQSAANVVIQNANAVSAKASSLIVVSGQTLQNIAAGNWFPLARELSAATTAFLAGTQQIDTGWDVRGKFAIPPGCGLALGTISAAGTSPVYAPFGSWREYTSDVE